MPVLIFKSKVNCSIDCTSLQGKGPEAGCGGRGRVGGRGWGVGVVFKMATCMASPVDLGELPDEICGRTVLQYCSVMSQTCFYTEIGFL